MKENKHFKLSERALLFYLIFIIHVHRGRLYRLLKIWICNDIANWSILLYEHYSDYIIHMPGIHDWKIQSKVLANICRNCCGPSLRGASFSSGRNIDIKTNPGGLLLTFFLPRCKLRWLLKHVQWSSSAVFQNDSSLLSQKHFQPRWIWKPLWKTGKIES